MSLVGGDLFFLYFSFSLRMALVNVTYFSHACSVKSLLSLFFFLGDSGMDF